MKNRKYQFSLATLFVALTVAGITMSGYRYHTYVEERIDFHTSKRDLMSSGMDGIFVRLNIFLESREALLAGDEVSLAALATRLRAGQPMEIAYVPVQLAILDKDISKLRAGYTRTEALKRYHAEMVVEIETSRWRPWHRVPEMASPEFVSRDEVAPVGYGDNPQLLPIVGK